MKVPNIFADNTSIKEFHTIIGQSDINSSDREFLINLVDKISLSIFSLRKGFVEEFKVALYHFLKKDEGSLAPFIEMVFELSREEEHQYQKVLNKLKQVDLARKGVNAKKLAAQRALKFAHYRKFDFEFNCMRSSLKLNSAIKNYYESNDCKKLWSSPEAFRVAFNRWKNNSSENYFKGKNTDLSFIKKFLEDAEKSKNSSHD